MLTRQRRMFTIATGSRRCDNPRLGFESEKAKPPSLAFTPHEAFRSSGTPSQVPAGLDPFPLARFENRAFNDEFTTA